MTRHRLAGLCLALSALPGIAHAHSPIEGINNFYNGLLHPVFVPAHALLLVALGLWLGQRHLPESQGPLLGFFVATIAGLIAGPASSGWIEVVQLACAAVIGLLVAAAAKLAPALRIVAAAVAGFVVAFDSVPEELAGLAKFLSLIGTAIGMLIVVSYAIGMADFLKKKSWQRIGVRVLGSWIAASAVLVVALLSL